MTSLDSSLSRRESSRLLEASSRRVLDSATRQRRLNKQLEALEKDNFQDDPLTLQEVPKKKRPKFGIPSDQEDNENESVAQSSRKKKRTRGDHFKQRFRKTFTVVLEEERQKTAKSDKPNYFTVIAPPSRVKTPYIDNKHLQDSTGITTTPNQTMHANSFQANCIGSNELPARKFCSVCGFLSNYTCVSCGSRYCCIKCLGTHQDTRCLKWTV